MPLSERTRLVHRMLLMTVRFRLITPVLCATVMPCMGGPQIIGSPSHQRVQMTNPQCRFSGNVLDVSGVGFQCQIYYVVSGLSSSKQRSAKHLGHYYWSWIRVNRIFFIGRYKCARRKQDTATQKNCLSLLSSTSVILNPGPRDTLSCMF